MNYIDNIYCINLPSSKERKRHMKKEFKKIQVNPIFISAISPMDSNYKQNKRRFLNPEIRRRCYCVKKCNHKARSLREGEIAICLSHYKTYKKIVENGDKISLVVEDDVVFHKRFQELIDHIFNKLKFKDILLGDKPVVVFCGGRNNPKLAINDPEKYNYYLTKNGFYSNYCCILNKSAASILKKRAVPIARPDDSFKRNLIWHKKILGYHIRPSLVGELSAGINLPPVYARFSKNSSKIQFIKTMNNPIRKKGKNKIKR